MGFPRSANVIAKALNPFEQANGTHLRRHEGTGIGLCHCANLMNLFGGTLEIESEEDIGMAMTIASRRNALFAHPEMAPTFPQVWAWNGGFGSRATVASPSKVVRSRGSSRRTEPGVIMHLTTHHKRD
jgi:hypothetical protein